MLKKGILKKSLKLFDNIIINYYRIIYAMPRISIERHK